LVEIFNASSIAQDMTGWKLHITSGIDIDFYTFPAVTLQPGQHYLVMSSLSPLAGFADDTWSGLSYGIGFGDVQVLTGAGAQVDALQYGVGPTLGEGTPLPIWAGPTSTDSS
jgi:hypothetical protein